MDLKAARKLLHKIDALIINHDESEKLSRLEHDLLLSYVRSLYENLLAGEDQPQQKEREKPVKSEIPYSRPATVQGPQQEQVSSAKQPQDEHIKSEKQERPKVQQDFFNPASYPQKTASHSPESEQDAVQKGGERRHQPSPFDDFRQPDMGSEIKSHTQKGKETSLSMENKEERPENGSVQIEESDNNLEALFETPRAVDLSDRLSSQPLTKIEAGLGINERILTINELFGGNISAFEDTLAKLNSLTEFQDAKDFLIQGVAQKYNWGKEEKLKKANYFIRLVRRKFV